VNGLLAGFFSPVHTEVLAVSQRAQRKKGMRLVLLHYSVSASDDMHHKMCEDRIARVA
jgi:hypothetical protein